MATTNLPTASEMRATLKQVFDQDNACKDLLVAVDSEAAQLKSLGEWMSNADIESLRTSRRNGVTKGKRVEDTVRQCRDTLEILEEDAQSLDALANSNRTNDVLSETAKAAFQYLLESEMELDQLRLNPAMSSMLDAAIDRRAMRSGTTLAAELKDQLAAAQNHIAELTQQNKSLERSDTRSTHKIESLNESKKSLDKSNTELREKIKSLEESNSMLNAELGRRNQSVEDSNSVLNDELRQRIKSLEASTKSLQDSNSMLDDQLTELCRRESDLAEALQETRDTLQTAEDRIQRYTDDATSLQRNNGYADALLRCVSDYPEEGSHWEGLRHAMKWPSKIQCQPCQGQAPVWMEDWNTCPRPQTSRSFMQTICDACVCLYEASSSRTALDVEPRRLSTRDCLQHLVNCLVTVPEVHHGLCITFSIATKTFLAQAEASPFDITLLLCMAAHLVAVRCPSEPRRQSAAEIRTSASRHLDWSNRHLLDAVLAGWHGASASGHVEFCCPTVNGDGHAVYVPSVDAVLFIGSELKLGWLSRSCINFTKCEFGKIYMENPGTHEVIEFIIEGPKFVELWTLLAR
ncbi:hypothetical protein LMH87_002311 [Akanthomyces muscarius]|uniref:Uncharacterized protein n=1 Tax=Akanthomyces muscarius TaxID=2231603 RepID=A0A9W8Q6U3_AKAMU|nr:hypothetical protein LMH87_002311 [Akanthomyces muscarius]KAJ4147807.1 hypothetical protein LMH87_002311 [Akanthomyces muscarius]